MKSPDLTPLSITNPAPSSADLAAHFRHKNVLVMGGSGFMGFNLMRQLAEFGAQITVASRGITLPAMPYPAGVNWMRADLSDAESLDPVVLGRDIIFIVAGATGAVASINAPVEDLRSNLSGQLNLLEAIRRMPKLPRVILVGTRLVYGVAQYLPVDEKHPTNPNSAYGVHKLTAEKYHLLYHHLHALPTTVARVTVAYGPYTPASSYTYGVVSHFAQAILRGEAISIYGGGEQTRDFVYVDDVTDALLRLAACKQAAGEAINVGHGRPVTLAHLAETMIRVAGAGEIAHVPWPPDAEKVETGNFYTDVTRIHQLTGWRPWTPLEDGLRRVFEYMRQMSTATPARVLMSTDDHR